MRNGYTGASLRLQIALTALLAVVSLVIFGLPPGQSEVNAGEATIPGWYDTGIRLGELSGARCIDVTEPDVLLSSDRDANTFAYNWRSGQATLLNRLPLHYCPPDGWLYAKDKDATYRFRVASPVAQPVAHVPAGIGPDGVTYSYEGIGSPILKAFASPDGFAWQETSHKFAGSIESISAMPTDVRAVYVMTRDETPPARQERNYTIYASTDAGLTWDRRSDGHTFDYGPNAYGESLYRYLAPVVGANAPVDLLRMVAIDHPPLTRFYTSITSLSSDGGRSFRAFDPVEREEALQLVHTYEGILRLEQRYSGKALGDRLTDQILTLSRDGGQNWQLLSPLPTPLPGFTQTSRYLAVAPAAPSNVFLFNSWPVTTKLLHSPDGGHTWQQLENKSLKQYDNFVSPYLPLTVLSLGPIEQSDSRRLTPQPGFPTPIPGTTPEPANYPQSTLYALDLPNTGWYLSAPVPPSKAPGSIYFAETGHNLSGIFKQHWEKYGGLAQQGYPLTEPFREVSDTDGKAYTTQYFERAIFEMHPENAPPYNLLLSLVGTFEYQRRYGPAGASGQRASTKNPRFFPETGHTIGGPFRAYWESHGGLSEQGYPITDEFNEKSLLDGKTYTVQYFQRAVFELHPENVGTPYEVLLSQLGTFRHNEKHMIPVFPGR
jgi:hypothetical protein